MALPALDRGLMIVEKVLFAQGALRYGEVKGAVPGVGDASLNRLLKALMDDAWLARDRDGHYVRGSRLARWRSELGARVTIDSAIQAAVNALSETVRESVAYGRLNDGAIGIIHSVSCQDSITIIPPGGILNFEADHAGALAVLAQLDSRDRRKMLASPRSAIDSVAQLSQAITDSLHDNLYTDRSRARVGVSRMAIGIADPLGPSSLFYCLPTERMNARFDELSRELAKAADGIVRRIESSAQSR